MWLEKLKIFEKSSQGLEKDKTIYDHDLDIRSPFFMAFMSKAALNTMNFKFIISLGQSLDSSMVEFWLCVQRNWVQSPEVPSHWNSAFSKKCEVDLIQVPRGVQSSSIGKWVSNSVFWPETASHEVLLVPMGKLNKELHEDPLDSHTKCKSAYWIICNPPSKKKYGGLKRNFVRFLFLWGKEWITLSLCKKQIEINIELLLATIIKVAAQPFAKRPNPDLICICASLEA